MYILKKLIEVQNLLDVTRVEQTQHKKALISVVLNILACYTVVLREVLQRIPYLAVKHIFLVKPLSWQMYMYQVQSIKHQQI